MKTRRDMLRNCLRCGAVLALGGVASALGWRGRHGSCQQTNPCTACPQFDDCGLPKARDAKSQSSPAAPGRAQPAADHA